MNMLEQWVQAPYLNEATLAGISKQFAEEPQRPVVLPNFLQPEYAKALAHALQRFDCWSTTKYIYAAPDAPTERVSRERFVAADKAQRFSSHDLAEPLTSLVEPQGDDRDSHRDVMRGFFSFAAAEPQAFRNWLSAVVGVQLGQRCTCEVVRYRAGDFIAPHTDTHDSRKVGVNFYFDSEWQPNDGGQLDFDSKDTRCSVEPRFNQLTLIPIDPTYRHAVRAWTSSRIGRYGVSLSYRPATAEGM